MSNKKPNPAFHPTMLPTLILIIIWTGLMLYFFFFDRGLSNLSDEIIRWNFLLTGLTFVASGIMAIVLQEVPMGGIFYRGSKAIGLGGLSIVLGLVVGIGLFLSW